MAIRSWLFPAPICPSSSPARMYITPGLDPVVDVELRAGCGLTSHRQVTGKPLKASLSISPCSIIQTWGLSATAFRTRRHEGNERGRFLSDRRFARSGLIGVYCQRQSYLRADVAMNSGEERSLQTSLTIFRSRATNARQSDPARVRIPSNATSPSIRVGRPRFRCRGWIPSRSWECGLSA